MLFEGLDLSIKGYSLFIYFLSKKTLQNVVVRVALSFSLFIPRSFYVPLEVHYLSFLSLTPFGHFLILRVFQLIVMPTFITE